MGVGLLVGHIEGFALLKDSPTKCVGLGKPERQDTAFMLSEGGLAESEAKLLFPAKGGFVESSTFLNPPH